jgi:signal transduction histidine kinase
MPSNLADRIRLPHFLDTATYISMAAMSLLGISGLPGLRSQLLALGLLILFGLLYRFVFQTQRYRQNPHLYFGAQVFILGLLFLLGSNNSDAFNFLFLILCIHIAAVSPARIAALWTAISFGVVSLLTLATRGTGGIYAAVFYGITFVVSGFFGSTIQQVERERDRNQRLVEELQETQQKLQELAVVEERNRLARDLHDSVKQQVYAISMQLGAARTLLKENDLAYSPVAEAERLAKQTGVELSTLIRELRPPGLQSKTLAAALREYASEWSRRNNIDTAVHVQDHLGVGQDMEATLFRVAQEALSNVARHSRATNVSIELTREGPDVSLCIADNGEGFDVQHVRMGVGLHSMRERLAELGGSFCISSQKNHSGTQITAKLRSA